MNEDDIKILVGFAAKYAVAPLRAARKVLQPEWRKDSALARIAARNCMVQMICNQISVKACGTGHLAVASPVCFYTNIDRKI